MNVTDDVVFQQPTTLDERAEVAEACVLRLNLAMPTVLDTIDNQLDLAYSALPERLFLVDADGRVAWRGGMGPWGFDPDAWEKAIAELLNG